MKPKLAIVSFPWVSNVPYYFISNLTEILVDLSSQIVIIDGNTDKIKVNSDQIIFKDINVGMHHIKDIQPRIYSIFLWFFKSLIVQIKLSCELIRSRNDIELVIFYMAYPYYLLPLLTCKILNKKSLEIITRSQSKSSLSKLFKLQDSLIFALLDGISPESESLIKDVELYKYKNKILPEGMRFINTAKFTVKKPLEEREKVIGFVGRVTQEKGVLSLVNSVSLVPEDLKFIIIGDGDLRDKLIEIVSEKKLTNKVKLIGHISNDNLPNYLNQMKLLVLPTRHSEGLPTVILEAMACGTPILSTNEGGIKDVIYDKKTGFILKEISPSCISKNIINIINYPNLEDVSKNARELVDKEISYEVAVKRFAKIIEFDYLYPES